MWDYGSKGKLTQQMCIGLWYQWRCHIPLMTFGGKCRGHTTASLQRRGIWTLAHCPPTPEEVSSPVLLAVSSASYPASLGCIPTKPSSKAEKKKKSRCLRHVMSWMLDTVCYRCVLLWLVGWDFHNVFYILSLCVCSSVNENLVLRHMWYWSQSKTLQQGD